jgi:hypothetical protein
MSGAPKARLSVLSLMQRQATTPVTKALAAAPASSSKNSPLSQATPGVTGRAALSNTPHSAVSDPTSFTTPASNAHGTGIRVGSGAGLNIQESTHDPSAVSTPTVARQVLEAVSTNMTPQAPSTLSATKAPVAPLGPTNTVPLPGPFKVSATLLR